VPQQIEETSKYFEGDERKRGEKKDENEIRETLSGQR
jgi:hypothetical protein